MCVCAVAAREMGGWKKREGEIEEDESLLFIEFLFVWIYSARSASKSATRCGGHYYGKRTGNTHTQTRLSFIILQFIVLPQPINSSSHEIRKFLLSLYSHIIIPKPSLSIHLNLTLFAFSTVRTINHISRLEKGY